MGAQLRSIEEGHEAVRVLVVDDEDLVHWGFKLMLSNEPWAERCLRAKNAEAAIALAEKYEPHPAIIDVGLAGLTLGDLCHRLRIACPSTRVVLSTTADAIPASSVRACGAAGYISRGWGARDSCARCG